jgi:DNA-binding protein HU-beta
LKQLMEDFPFDPMTIVSLGPTDAGVKAKKPRVTAAKPVPVTKKRVPGKKIKAKVAAKSKVTVRAKAKVVKKAKAPVRKAKVKKSAPKQKASPKKSVKKSKKKN